MITKRLLLLCFFLQCLFTLSAQQGIIKGIVIDSLKSEPVEFASARLLTRSDTTFIKGSVTDRKGNFSIFSNPGSYILEVTFIGYKILRRDITLSAQKPDANLGVLFLYEDVQTLEQIVVTAKVPDMEVRGDTIEYNAAAYMSEENDLLQDLLKNMPGVELDNNGSLTVNGKAVTKILIDGKEFFNNDIKLALRNLPANMIKKIQLFQEQTEKSKTSGIKDSEGDQVLNLEVKEEFKQSIFGDVVGGYGSKDRYLAKSMVNMLRNDNQFSVLAGGNNINEGIENAGFMQTGGGGYSMGGGIDDKKEFAANFSTQKSDTFRINGNIRYSGNSNVLNEFTRTEYINSEKGNWLESEGERSRNKQKELRFDLNFSWKPDSLTTVYFRSSGGYSENKDSRQTDFSSSYVDRADTINHGWTNYYSKGDGKNFSGSLSAGRKLNSKGRIISLYLNGGIRYAESNGENNSLTIYPASGEEDKIIDQRISRDNDNKSFSISVAYVEPVTDKNSLNITYSYGESRSDNVNDTYRKDLVTNEYTVLDSLYARKGKNLSRSQRIELGFQSVYDTYEYNVGFNIEPYHSRNTVNFKDSVLDDLKQNVVNYSPRIRFRYKKNKNASFNFNYQGRTNQPTTRQLSADTTLLSSSSKSYGNPGLKPGFENHVDIYYQKSDFEKMNFLYVSAAFSNTINQIVSYSIVDEDLNTKRTYKNVSGNWGGNFSVMFDTPLKKEKLKFSTYSSVYYNRRKAFINEKENISNSTSLSENLTFSFKSPKIESRLNLTVRYNLTKNSLQKQSNIETGNLIIHNTFNATLPLDFRFQNEISYTHNYGYSSDFKTSAIMWNSSLSKSFLKKKTGTLKLQLYDILKNQNDSFHYTVTDYTLNRKTNLISRYFMLSFSYRFNVSKGGSDYDGHNY